MSITKEEVEAMLNRTDRKVEVTDEALELICSAMNEPEFDGFKFSEQLVTYQDVLQGKANLVDYVNAIKFCSFLDSNQGNYTDAYIKTFFHRDFVQERYQKPTNSPEYKQLTSASTRYRKTKLVVGILTMAQVPFHILFQGYREKAMNRLVYEMDHAPLPKDRIAAAREVLNYSSPPENLRVEVDFGKSEDNVVDRYENALKKLVEEQKNLITNGADVSNVTNMKLIEAEVIDQPLDSSV